MQFGRCYEEFEVGAVYKHWPGRTITESDDMLFCMLTMNHNPLHIDANYTENTEFKQPLVAGPLVGDERAGQKIINQQTRPWCSDRRNHCLQSAR